MTRPLPLAILALVFLWLAANVDTVWLWMITVVALAALVALVIAMRFRDMYTGPKTLGDDFRSITRKVMRDEGGEADRIEYMRELEENEVERKRMIDEIDDEDYYDATSPTGRRVSHIRNEDGKE